MNQECLQIIKKIAAKQKDGDLNLCLKVLSRIIGFKGQYRNMDISSFDNIEDESIVPELQDESRDSKLSDGEENFKDLRLLNIRLQNIRQFPLALYGLRFERNGNPCSTFLVGRNCTGKSTIFSAIEYYYAQKVSNANLKSISDYEGYLTNCFVSKDYVRLSIKTKADSHRIDYMLGEMKRICMPAMFCSDYDIYNIGIIGDGDLGPFIIEQMGYTDLYEIQNILQTIKMDILKAQQAVDKHILLEKEDLEDILKVYMVNYYSEKNKKNIIDLCIKYTTVENGIAVAIHDIKDSEFWKKEIDNNCLFYEDWKQLQTIVLLPHLEGADAEIEKLGEKLIQKYDYLKTLLQLEPVRAINLYEEWRKSIFDWSKGQGPDNKIRDPNKLLLVLTQVVYNLNFEINVILTNFIQDYSGFIEDSLKFFAEEYETFKINKAGGLRMLIHVAKEEGEQTTTSSLFPGTYLNSFRFKLYAIALKLSLAFYYMKRNRCILPIAIDDVFNANDFDNSIHLQYFVHKIYELYHNKVSKTIPLQLIMFTHDEIILSAFQKGYNTREIIKWNESQEDNLKSQQKYNLYKDNCIIGRLHPYQDAKYIQLKENKDGLDNKAHNEPDFYNLYTEINYYGRKQ